MRTLCTIVFLGAVAFFAAAPRAGAINLSLGATATANSQYSSYGPSLAVDGDNATAWVAPDHGSPGDPNWITVDLGAVFDVDQIVVFYAEPDGLYAAYTSVYDFYTGTTGSDWDLRASGTFIDEGPLSDRQFILDFPGGLSMRYAMHEVVGGSHWSSVAEIGIFAEGGQQHSYVPAPGSLWLLGLGALGIVARLRTRRIAPG
jgi:hypothetical protein